MFTWQILGRKWRNAVARGDLMAQAIIEGQALRQLELDEARSPGDLLHSSGSLVHVRRVLAFWA